MEVVFLVQQNQKNGGKNLKLRKFGIVLLASLLVFSLVGCSPAEKDSKDDVLKIGFIQDITGGAAGYGVPMWNYVKMLVDEINAEGGIDGKTKIELIGYDAGSDPTEAISVYNRLVSLDKVSVVIGSTISNEMVPVAPIAASSEIPTLSTSLDISIVKNADGSTRDYNYILQLTSIQQGYATAYYLVEELGYTDIAVIYNEGNAYCTAITKALIECIENNYSDTVKLNVVTYGSSETDYSVFFARAIGSSTQVAYIGCQHETAEILGQFRNSYDIPVYGPNSYMPFITELGKVASQDIHYFTGLDITSERFAESNQVYREKFGHDIVAQAYQCSDGLYMIIEAFRASGGSTDPKVLNEHLKKVTAKVNQSEEFSFDSNNCPAGAPGYIARLEEDGTEVIVAKAVVPTELIEKRN